MLKNLKSCMRQAGFVFLALSSLVALAQTPPASKVPTGGVGQRTEGQGQKSEVRSPKPKVSEPGAEITATAAPIRLSGYVPDDKYKLRVGDKISFQILEDRDAPKSLVVADSGELDVPYLGRVAASDKTSKQLADELKTRLEKEYYHQATVIIALDVANKFLGRVYVWGQVRNQGPIDIAVNENLTAGKAILRAGGFGDFANKKRVKVVRSGGADSVAKQSFELNMVDILEKGKTEKDMVLQPDDFIIVPSRLINF
jgi:protein involved in polysaccharide export with SLBB domain